MSIRFGRHSIRVLLIVLIIGSVSAPWLVGRAAQSATADAAVPQGKAGAPVMQRAGFATLKAPLRDLSHRDDQPAPGWSAAAEASIISVLQANESTAVPSSATVGLHYINSAALSGPIAAVVEGALAYCATPSGLLILDLAAPYPAPPVFVAELYLTSSSSVSDIAKSGNFVYLTVSGWQPVNMYVVDVSDPANPIVVGTTNIPDAGNFILADGSYAYLGGSHSTGGLWILDVSVPSAPVQVTKLFSSISSMIKSGNHLFVCEYPVALRTLDVTTPSSPSVVGTPLSGAWWWDMAMDDNKVYGIETDGWDVVDVSDPLAPAQIGGGTTNGGESGGGYHIGVVDANHVVASYGYPWYGFNVIDVTDPVAPVIIYNEDTRGNIQDIHCSGGQVCLADGDAMILLDLSNIEGYWPRREFVTGAVLGVDLQGNYAYVGCSDGGLRVLDISTPAHPVMLVTGQPPSAVGYLDVEGDYAYLPSYADGLTIVDISNPAAPTSVGNYDTPGDANQVVVRGNYAYVADYAGGLQIINVSNPHAPALAGSYLGSANVARVALSGNYAYLGCRTEGLKILDISNPAAPSLVGQTPIQSGSGDVRGVAVRGGYACVAADGGVGMRIVDCTNPAAPVVLPGTFDGNTYAFGVTVRGSYAYVAHWNGHRISVVNIADPANPVAEAVYTDAVSPRWVAVQDTLLAFGDVNSVQFLSVNGLCPITMTGDINLSSSITSADVIGLVNYVFKGGAEPLPCVAAGDVNCSGTVTSADIIGLVGYVFKSGAPPCDGCTSPLAAGC